MFLFGIDLIDNPKFYIWTIAQIFIAFVVIKSIRMAFGRKRE